MTPWDVVEALANDDCTAGGAPLTAEEIALAEKLARQIVMENEKQRHD